MGIKAVGFDLDGTLYPAWRMYAVSIDIGMRHPRFLGAFGEARKVLRRRQASAYGSAAGGASGGAADKNTAAWRAADEDAAGSKIFRQRQAELVAGFLGIDSASAFRAIDAIIYSTVEKKFASIRPYAGAADCLAALRGAGLRLGLLSDLPPTKKIELLGLGSYFDFLLCSEDFGALKPDPRPFRALAERFGAEPDSILYVGNKRHYDIKGAKAAGMRTAFIGRRPLPEADFSFRSWSDLAPWVLNQKN